MIAAYHDSVRRYGRRPAVRSCGPGTKINPRKPVQLKMKAEIVSAFRLSGLVLEASSRDLIANHIIALRPIRKQQEELTRIVEHVSANPECKTALPLLSCTIGMHC